MVEENEIELIDMIRAHENPACALIIAIHTILSYLEQRESSLTPSSVDLQEHA